MAQSGSRDPWDETWDPNEPMFDGWPLRYSPYHYRPTPWICALFVALFALATRTCPPSRYWGKNKRFLTQRRGAVLHLVLGIRHRLWWILAMTVCCGAGETIGWGGRLWSSNAPFERTPFMMQCVIQHLLAASH
jgi:hypothetical protein